MPLTVSPLASPATLLTLSPEGAKGGDGFAPIFGGLIDADGTVPTCTLLPPTGEALPPMREAMPDLPIVEPAETLTPSVTLAPTLPGEDILVVQPPLQANCVIPIVRRSPERAPEPATVPARFLPVLSPAPARPSDSTPRTTISDEAPAAPNPPVARCVLPIERRGARLLPDQPAMPAPFDEPADENAPPSPVAAPVAQDTILPLASPPPLATRPALLVSTATPVVPLVGTAPRIDVTRRDNNGQIQPTSPERESAPPAAVHRKPDTVVDEPDFVPTSRPEAAATPPADTIMPSLLTLPTTPTPEVAPVARTVVADPTQPPRRKEAVTPRVAAAPRRQDGPDPHAIEATPPLRRSEAETQPSSPAPQNETGSASPRSPQVVRAAAAPSNVAPTIENGDAPVQSRINASERTAMPAVNPRAFAAPAPVSTTITPPAETSERRPPQVLETTRRPIVADAASNPVAQPPERTPAVPAPPTANAPVAVTQVAQPIAPTIAASPAPIVSLVATPVQREGGVAQDALPSTRPTVEAAQTRTSETPVAHTPAPTMIRMPEPTAAVILPAAQAFGAAIRQAIADERKPARLSNEPAAPTSVLTATASAPAQFVAQVGPTLDTADRRWPHAMAEQIDRLRDAANETSTRIRLLPDALGPVDVAVRRDGDAVHVHFTAAQPETRQLLVDAQPRLAEAADARGLKFGRTDVSSGGDLTGERQQQQRAAPQPQTPSRPAPARVRAAVADATDTRIA